MGELPPWLGRLVRAGKGVKRFIKRLAYTIAVALVFPLAASERLAGKFSGEMSGS